MGANAWLSGKTGAKLSVQDLGLNKKGAMSFRHAPFFDY
jgi:hypothetical protein